VQLARRQDGEDHYELLIPDSQQQRGLIRLPRSNPGHIFFDMEGDPLEPGGLEYLFGVLFQDQGALRYRPFWAHSRIEECHAFEMFMDFVAKCLSAYPDMHIYHYARLPELGVGSCPNIAIEYTDCFSHELGDTTSD
jgi:predicted RecB family nuclease